MSVEQVRSGEYYMDQAALDAPPAAPSKYMFIVPAIAHVGRAKVADWNDAERTSLAAGDEAARSGIAAIQSAAKLLHQAVMDDDVHIYFRSSSGGALQAMTASDWTNDYMGVNIARSSGGPAVHGSVYLFVDRAELAEKFPLAGAASETERHVEDRELSPYLQLLIAVAQKQGITAETHSTVESLKADLLADAPRFGLSVGTGNSGSDISPTWAEELAKAIRWPSARLGRAKGGNQKT